MAMYFYFSERGGRGGRRGGGVNKKTKTNQNTNRTCYHVSFPSHPASIQHPSSIHPASIQHPFIS
jgi:hypothetical protein